MVHNKHKIHENIFQLTHVRSQPPNRIHPNIFSINYIDVHNNVQFIIIALPIHRFQLRMGGNSCQTFINNYYLHLEQK